MIKQLGLKGKFKTFSMTTKFITMTSSKMKMVVTGYFSRRQTLTLKLDMFGDIENASFEFIF